jgi:hypothetical protein
MTDEMMSLRGLLEKSPDADLLREMIGFAAQRLIELEVGGLTGAGFGEKSSERLVQRNGYRERDWETRAGTVEGTRPGQFVRSSESRIAGSATHDCIAHVFCIYRTANASDLGRSSQNHSV